MSYRLERNTELYPLQAGGTVVNFRSRFQPDLCNRMSKLPATEGRRSVLIYATAGLSDRHMPWSPKEFGNIIWVNTFLMLCRFFDIFSGKLPIDLPEISLVQWSIYLLPCLLNF